MSTFVVHQALFGQDDSWGFGLLSTTHPNQSLVRRMGNSTDLIEQVPDQVSWQPTLRGRKWNEYYLLFKTYPDSSIGMRPGRVFSHVLIIESVNLPTVSNLRPLLDLLPIQLNKDIVLDPVSVAPSLPQQIDITPRLGYMLQQYVSPTRSGPLIWAGQYGFEEAIVLLWQAIDDREREQLSFNIGFMPTQLRNPADRLQLVSVPQSLLDRWRPNFTVIDINASHTNLNELEAFLAGDFNNCPNLSFILKELGIDSRSLNDLDALYRVASIASNITGASLQEILALASVIHYYKPSENSAKQIKDRIIVRLKHLISNDETGNLARLGSLKNNSLSAVDLSTIATAITTRLIELMLLGLDSQLLSIITQWPNEPSRTWWRTSLLAALENIFSKWTAGSERIVFGLWSQPFESVNDFFDLLPDTERIESSLLSALPDSLPSKAWETGIKLAQVEHWLRLHLACLLKLFNLQDALKKHLEIDVSSTYMAALQLARDQQNPLEFIDAAITLEEGRLIELAGQLCNSDPDLLKNLDITKNGWQKVWLSSVGSEGNLWNSLKQPNQITESIFDHLIAGGQVLPELIKKISMSTQADLRAYSNRSTLWPLLDKNNRERFLLATATGLLTHEKPEDSSYHLEPELIEVFSRDNFFAHVIANPTISLGRLVTYIDRFKLAEANIVKYIQTYNGRSESGDIVALGQLIHRNRWTTAAEQVVNLARRISAFKQAIPFCIDLLSRYNRVKVYFYFGDLLQALPTTVDIRSDWWSTLLEEAKLVYPDGPRQNGIWSDSGGKDHVVKVSVNGGEQWNDLLSGIRRGRFSVSIDSLLAVMIEDSPRNETFKMLQQTISNAR
ncbi:hypothetical protein GO755_04455 [Spirosoma sp. HMF4905]|uniref:Uncharacterized protein n=1 Tax=Spirosoma arboris TaxID=2682092 RepID=A0A7K1S628_9BACT|nr:hypothetical protein [Spirosoma arboris]MVM29273.1 hypothetical protein [Spirosoma arboris]